jgi:hypothetical protein
LNGNYQWLKGLDLPMILVGDADRARIEDGATNLWRWSIQR